MSNQEAYEEICEKAKKYDELKEAVKSIKESLEKCQKIHLQQGTSESEAMASAYSTSIDVINTHTEGVI